MNEQIEEIAKVIHDSDIADINTFPVSMSECLGKHGARRTGAAIALVKAGFRKQSEGEWREDVIAFCNVCSSCRAMVDRSAIKCNSGKLHYCPNCGAKMKGGAE